MERLIFTDEEVDNIDLDEITKNPPFEYKAIEILRDYLQPDSSTSLDAAARSIIKLLPDPIDVLELTEPTGSPDLTDSLELTDSSESTDLLKHQDSSYELYALWGLCISVAEQIPYHHPSLVKFVRLILMLRHSPRAVNIRLWDVGESLRYISGLKLIGQILRESYNTEPIFSVDNGEPTWTPDEARRWVNLNAFYAVLEHFEGGDMDPFCFWTMREAFETRSYLSPSLNEAAFNCRIAAAAQWIIHGGQTLFQIIRVREMHPDLPDGDKNLNLHNWQMWKDKFKDAGKREDGINDESRQLATNAANLMDALEKSML